MKEILYNFFLLKDKSGIFVIGVGIGALFIAHQNFFGAFINACVFSIIETFVVERFNCKNTTLSK